MKYILILAALMMMCGCAQTRRNIPNELKNSVILNLPLNGNADDYSGNGRNGQIIGAEVCTDRHGKEGGAYTFNGINDYIVIPHFTNKPADNFTISMWLKATGASAGRPYNSFIELGNVPNHTWNEAYNFVRGGFDLWDRSSGSWYPESDNYNNEWIQVVISYGDKSKSLYVDGKLVAKRIVELPLKFAGNDNLNIGAEIADNQYFCGEIDDVIIFNKCLSSEEIKKLYEQSK